MTFELLFALKPLGLSNDPQRLCFRLRATQAQLGYESHPEFFQ
jgi:hypothetical protein